MKIQIPFIYVTYPGGRPAYAALLGSIQNELPKRPPDISQIKELDTSRAASLILLMLSCGKTVFVDNKLLQLVLDEISSGTTSEMLSRIYTVH